ncbi:MAG: CpaF family protein [Bdellovibrionales bacterium]|nr:CpaF family protein [Bdellovibrionales bacterium]
MDLISVTNDIISKITEITYDEYALGDDVNQEYNKNKINILFEDMTNNFKDSEKKRIFNEFFSNGPLESLLSDSTISEIIVNSPNSIYYEKFGILHQHDDHFFSDFTYEKFIERICDQTNSLLNLDFPFADTAYKNFRISIVDKCITHHYSSINFRRHPLQSWTFEKLLNADWCSESAFQELKKVISEKKNFLVIGSTGAGKTSVLNSFLNLTESNERSIIIEDTSEITVPNRACLKLLTKQDQTESKKDITQTDLVKKSLRLRPDRIVMGEIRGGEAKDFLMALSTGHKGSFATLHASDAHQALIRLEMLIQMGAPSWSLSAIRRLIFLSLEMIIVIGKNDKAERILKGGYQLTALEEHGFLIEKVF